ncbi:ATPase, T2SS/T4P/T4SS family [Bacillus safensis]|uniref:ATPase, T2SS/T4P/T4SS family n=1 Tax=Bacillus safensis TaxID=561879 RepID=UPI00366D8364
MKNVIQIHDLVKPERNRINLDRLLYQKATDSKPKPKIKFENKFQSMTEYVKDQLSQEKYREILKDSFGDLTKQKKLREVIHSMVSDQKFLDKFSTQLADYKLDYVTNVLVEKICGLDVLQPLADSDTITDINIIDYNNIWVDDIYKGTYKTDIAFETREDYEDLCNRFAFASGKQYSVSKPSVDAVFPQLRVNFVGQDLSEVISTQIRIISKKLRLSTELIKETGYASDLMMRFLSHTIKSQCHLIGGATGTGKTELLRYLWQYSLDKNTIVIEDTPETYLLDLYPDKPIKMWKNREAISEGKQEFGYSYHLRNAMRQNPFYIVLQEARGGEALQMLKASETGHKISGTTHSDSAIENIDRMIDLCLEEQHHDPNYYGKKLTKNFKIGVHVARYGKNEVRKISQIVEYIGYSDNKVEANVLFEYDHKRKEHIQKNRVSLDLWYKLTALNDGEDIEELSALKPQSEYQEAVV